MPSYATSLEPIFFQSTDTHNSTTNKQSTMTYDFPSENNTYIYAPSLEITFIQSIDTHNYTT